MIPDDCGWLVDLACDRLETGLSAEEWVPAPQGEGMARLTVHTDDASVLQIEFSHEGSRFTLICLPASASRSPSYPTSLPFIPLVQTVVLRQVSLEDSSLSVGWFDIISKQAMAEAVARDLTSDGWVELGGLTARADPPPREFWRKGVVRSLFEDDELLCLQERTPRRVRLPDIFNLGDSGRAL